MRHFAQTLPLAAIARPQIEALKQWAAEAGARGASNDTQLAAQLKQLTIGQEIKPLEVD